MVRLRGVLDQDALTQLAETVADHVLATVRPLAEVVVVTSDADVASWSIGHDVAVVADPGEGLNGAAAAGVERAGGATWAVLHCDLPYLTSRDLEMAFESGPSVLAPTHDGGTSLVVGTGSGFPFSYGPGSFHRHLAARASARVLVRTGLALDLDTPRDLARYRRIMS